MAPDEDDQPHDHKHGIIEELREMPVGTNDPNIIGDAGPLDVPPGSDPHPADEFVADDDETEEDAVE